MIQGIEFNTSHDFLLWGEIIADWLSFPLTFKHFSSLLASSLTFFPQEKVWQPFILSQVVAIPPLEFSHFTLWLCIDLEIKGELPFLIDLLFCIAKEKVHNLRESTVALRTIWKFNNIPRMSIYSEGNCTGIFIAQTNEYFCTLGKHHFWWCQVKSVNFIGTILKIHYKIRNSNYYLIWENENTESIYSLIWQNWVPLVYKISLKLNETNNRLDTYVSPEMLRYNQGQA